MAYVVVVEHLNHLGIVAEVSREIGVAEWLDAQYPSRQRVTVAMMLNGLRFSSTTGDATATGCPLPTHSSDAWRYVWTAARELFR